MSKKVTVYIDGTDWRYEVGHASDGNKIYPSVADLQKYSPCWDGCGVVECEISFKKWAVEENESEMYESSSKVYPLENFKTNESIIKYESALKRLEFLEHLVEDQKIKVSNLKEQINK